MILFHVLFHVLPVLKLCTVVHELSGQQLLSRVRNGATRQDPYE